MTPHRRSALQLLRILVTLALLGWVLRGVDWAALRQVLLGANPFWMLLACLGALFRVVLLSLRWKLILAVRRIHFSLTHVYRLFLVSALWDVLIPANLGGDAYRIRQAATQGGLLRSGTTVVWDRALGSFTQLMLGALALYLTRDQPPTRAVFGEWAGGFALALLSAGALLLVTAMWLGRTAPRSGGNGARERLHKLLHMPRRVLLGGMAYSLLAHMATIGIFYCVLAAIALDTAIPPAYFVLSVTVATLALSVPVSIAGIGVIENLFAIFFEPFGVTTAASVAFAWLAMLAGRGSTAILGGLLFALGRESRTPEPTSGAVDRG
jgi:uncharacterized membrane protein YbhN (UPF0104 family)